MVLLFLLFIYLWFILYLMGCFDDLIKFREQVNKSRKKWEEKDNE